MIERHSISMRDVILIVIAVTIGMTFGRALGWYVEETLDDIRYHDFRCQPPIHVPTEPVPVHPWIDGVV